MQVLLQSTVSQHLNALRALCHYEHIDKCIVFGSAARADFGSGSDVDVVVAFAPDERVTLFRLRRITQNMERVIGRPVDLHTWAEIHPKIQAKIRREGVPIVERRTG